MDPRGGGSTGGGGGGGGGRIYPGLMPARPAPELPPALGSSGPGRPQGLPPPLPPRVLRHPAPHSPSPTHHATAHTDTSTLYGPGQSGGCLDADVVLAVYALSLILRPLQSGKRQKHFISPHFVYDHVARDV